jgi:hypothetical protein
MWTGRAALDMAEVSLGLRAFGGSGVAEDRAEPEWRFQPVCFLSGQCNVYGGERVGRGREGLIRPDARSAEVLVGRSGYQAAG